MNFLFSFARLGVNISDSHGGGSHRRRCRTTWPTAATSASCRRAIAGRRRHRWCCRTASACASPTSWRRWTGSAPATPITSARRPPSTSRHPPSSATRTTSRWTTCRRRCTTSIVPKTPAAVDPDPSSSVWSSPISGSMKTVIFNHLFVFYFSFNFKIIKKNYYVKFLHYIAYTV